MGVEHRGILRVAYVWIGLNDLKKASRFYRETLGLVETAGERERVYLRCWHEPFHHSLIVEQTAENRLVEIGLEVRDGQDLDALQGKLAARGIPVERAESESVIKGIGRSISFHIPGGHRFRVFDSMEEVGYVTGYASPDWNVPRALRGTPAPLFLGHVGITSPHPEETIRFLQEVLEFQISEWIKAGDNGSPMSALLFRTTNGQDIAVFPGKEAGLHHIAFVKLDETDILNDSTFLVEDGVKIDLYGLTLQSYGKTYSLYLYDPFGVRLELFSGGRFSELHPEYQPVVWTESQLKKALSYYDNFLNEDFLKASL